MAWFEMAALVVNSVVSPWLSLAIPDPEPGLTGESMSYAVQATLSEDDSLANQDSMGLMAATIQNGPQSCEEETVPEVSWEDILEDASDAYGVEQERKKKEQEEQDEIEREHENKYGW